MNDPRNLTLVVCAAFILFICAGAITGHLHWSSEGYVVKQGWMDTAVSSDKAIGIFQGHFVLTTTNCIDAGDNLMANCEQGAIVLPISGN